MSLDAWKTFLDWGAVIFVFFTFVFGAGALVAGKKITDRDSERLRQFDKDLTAAKTGLANARTELGEQQERAAVADGKVAGLQKDAADARAAQQKVEIELEKQRERTAEAETALLEMQQKMADRKLSFSQQEEITARLKPWSGVDIDVMVWGETPEITIISNQVLSSMQQAGWRVHVGHAIGGGMAVRGLLVGVNPTAGENEVRAADALVAALKAEKIGAALWKLEEMRTPQLMTNNSYTGAALVRLFIGTK